MKFSIGLRVECKVCEQDLPTGHDDAITAALVGQANRYALCPSCRQNVADWQTDDRYRTRVRAWYKKRGIVVDELPRVFIAYGHWDHDGQNFIICRCPGTGVVWRKLMQALHRTIKGFAPETRQGDWNVDGDAPDWDKTKFPRYDWQDGKWVKCPRNAVDHV